MNAGREDPAARQNWASQLGRSRKIGRFPASSSFGLGSGGEQFGFGIGLVARLPVERLRDSVEIHQFMFGRAG